MKGRTSARWLATGAVLVLTLAACGGAASPTPGQSPTAGTPSEPPLATDGQSPGTGGEPEVASLTLGVLPLADVAPVYIALAEGYFEDEGLEVTVELVQGGAAAIPSLVNGDLHITFGNYVSFFLAGSQGIELRIIAEQDRATPGFSVIMALPDSGIVDAAGLVGHKLAVNTLSNVAEITSRAQVKDADADPEAVEYIEIAFPDMIAALDRGDVDAIFAVEPFKSLALQDPGAIEVVDAYSGRLEGFPVAGFQSTADFAEQNPNTIAAFQRAMVRASHAASDDPDEVVAILPTYTSLTPELAEGLAQPQYISEIDVGELARVPELMVEFGLLEEAPDVNSLVILTE